MWKNEASLKFAHNFFFFIYSFSKLMEPLRLFTELTLDKCDIFCSFALIYSDKLLISSLSVRNSNGNLNLMFSPMQ